MGKELEYKLEVCESAILERIMADPQIEALSTEEFHQTAMLTEYFDSPDQRFSQRH